MQGESASRAGVLFIGVDGRLEKFRDFLAERGFPGRICRDAPAGRVAALSDIPAIIIFGAKIDAPAVAKVLRSETRLSSVPILSLAEQPDAKTSGSVLIQESLPGSVEPLTFFNAVLRWTSRAALKAPAPIAAPASPPKAAPPPTLQGTLGAGTILKLIYQLSREPGDHLLAVKMFSAKFKVRIRHGCIVNIASNHVPTLSLDAVLQSEGKIGAGESEAAFAKARSAGARHGEMLVKLGVLNERELNAALRRQKRLKLRYLLAHPKPQGEYSVRAVDPAAANVAPLDLPAGSFLFETVVNELPPRVAADALTDMAGLHSRVELTGEATEVLQSLDCPPSFFEAPQFINGKTIAEIRSVSFNPDAAKWMNVLYLLAALDCVRFSRPEKTASRQRRN